MIQYVYETYGRERVAMVCEVNTYRGRSAIRDVAFALGLPQHQIDALAKTVDLYDRHSLDTLLDGVGLPVDGRVAKRLVELSQQLIDAPRHLSIHVGGMVVSARPLHEVVHNQPARMPDRTIIPWDKDDLTALAEHFGVNLIKIDLLGLGMLKVISRVFEMLEARDEERRSLHGFRYDERVYDGHLPGRHDRPVPDRVARADQLPARLEAAQPPRRRDQRRRDPSGAGRDRRRWPHREATGQTRSRSATPTLIWSQS